MKSQPPARIPEIDWLKGFAILCVLLIHSEPLVGTMVHEYLVNRAVPIFIVLFGATSELWWHRRTGTTESATLRAWYASRLWRLMAPVWGMVAVWWAATIAFDANGPRALHTFVATALGYMPWIGTGWFVTLILQLVVLFPLLHFGVHRLGAPLALALTLALLLWSHIHILEIVDWMRRLLMDSAPVSGFFVFYYFWIFAPARFFPVVAGIAFAQRIIVRGGMPAGRARWNQALILAALLIAGFALRTHLTDRFWQAGLQAMLDVLLTGLLLMMIGGLRTWSPGTRVLAWCGESSWGLYLGQLLVHTIVKMLGFKVELQPAVVRWGYFGALLVGSVGFVMIGDAVRSVPLRDWLPRRQRKAIA